MKKAFYFGLATLVALMVFGCAGQAPQKPDKTMTGTWVLQVETPSGSGTPTFKLEQEGQALSGTYVGYFGEAPVQGKVEGEAFELNFQSQGIDIKYTGTVKGNTMEGEIDFGGQGNGTFKGRKS
jgi:hypothetical protein